MLETSNHDRDTTAQIIMDGINGGKNASQIAQDLGIPEQTAQIATFAAALGTITGAHVQAIEARADRQDEARAAFDQSNAHLPADKRPRMIFA